MKLLNVRIKNFKSLKNIDISLNDKINLLIGKNNSGKSNFIEALLFLSGIMNGKLNRREFRRIIYGKSLTNELKYELIFSLSEKERLGYISGLNISNKKKKKLNISLGSNVKYVGRFYYRIYPSEKCVIDEQIYIKLNGREIEFMTRDKKDGFLTVTNFATFVDINTKGTKKAERLEDESIFNQLSKYLNLSELNLLGIIKNFIDGIYCLKPTRSSRERKRIKGNFRLNMDGSNLPEVLHSFASSKRMCFEQIVEDTKSIIENILDIRVPIIEEGEDTYISILEEPFGDVEYSWDNVSSGTKEIIFQITLLHISRNGSLLTIEEPEIHLHGDAIRKFVGILKDIIKKEDKQIIITTHSPLFIDLLDQENLFYVTREDGNTSIAPLSQEPNIKSVLVKEGLSISNLFIPQYTSFILIVEGRDDVKIFEEFLRKEGIEPKIEKIIVLKPEKGGSDSAINFAKTFKKIRIPIPFLLVLDSDKNFEKKKKECEKEFKNDEYYILPKKEIEEYLIDSYAISKIVRKKQNEVEKIILKTRGEGKEKLKKVLKNFDLGMSSDTKTLIARHLKSTPQDIRRIITLIEIKIQTQR